MYTVYTMSLIFEKLDDVFEIAKSVNVNMYAYIIASEYSISRM